MPPNFGHPRLLRQILEVDVRLRLCDGGPKRRTPQSLS
jgi:hypothetical protein